MTVAEQRCGWEMAYVICMQGKIVYSAELQIWIIVSDPLCSAKCMTKQGNASRVAMVGLIQGTYVIKLRFCCSQG